MRSVIYIVSTAVLVRSLIKQLLLEHITHSYQAAVVGRYRYSFFALFRDYYEHQSRWVQEELIPLLGRLAREVKYSGVVTKPFPQDAETTRNEVLETKNWTREQLVKVSQTPSLLIINTDFADFDPQIHPWFHLYFGETTDLQEKRKYEDQIEMLIAAALDPNKNLFEEANKAVNEVGRSDFNEVFELKPGIQGLSIDIVKAGDVVRRLYRRMTYRSPQQEDA